MHKVSSDKRRDGLPKYIRLYADGREGGFVLVTASHPYDVKFYRRQLCDLLCCSSRFSVSKQDNSKPTGDLAAAQPHTRSNV